MKALSTLITIALCFVSCTRTTMVSGTIINCVTGKPIAGMPVSLYAYNGNEPRDSSNPKKVGEANTVTDASGNYALEYSDSGIDDVDLYVDYGKFCFDYFDEKRSANPRPNNSTEVNIQIDSIDADLYIDLQNLSGQSDKAFVRVRCNVLEDTAPCCNYGQGTPVVPGGSASLHFRVSSSRKVPVYWSTSSFSGWNAPHIDSVYCPRNTKTTWTIQF